MDGWGWGVTSDLLFDGRRARSFECRLVLLSKFCFDLRGHIMMYILQLRPHLPGTELAFHPGIKMNSLPIQGVLIFRAANFLSPAARRQRKERPCSLNRGSGLVTILVRRRKLAPLRVHPFAQVDRSRNLEEEAFDNV